MPSITVGGSNNNSSGGGGSSRTAPNEGNSSSPSPSSGEFSPGGGSGGGGRSDSGGDSVGASLSRLAGPNLGGPPRNNTARAPQPPPLRLGPNRDWVIVLECQENGVVLPGGQKISTSALTRPMDANGNPLLAAVKQMIDRRQSTIRRGEVPYQPHIRFLVHPDGERTYYYAYPALDSLVAPKTSEKITPNLN
jgi:hypothetical protein